MAVLAGWCGLPWFRRRTSSRGIVYRFGSSIHVVDAMRKDNPGFTIPIRALDMVGPGQALAGMYQGADCRPPLGLRCDRQRDGSEGAVRGDFDGRLPQRPHRSPAEWSSKMPVMPMTTLFPQMPARARWMRPRSLANSDRLARLAGMVHNRFTGRGGSDGPGLIHCSLNVEQSLGGR
jgi:hypothetical protein